MKKLDLKPTTVAFVISITLIIHNTFDLIFLQLSRQKALVKLPIRVESAFVFLAQQIVSITRYRRIHCIPYKCRHTRIRNFRKRR